MATLHLGSETSSNLPRARPALIQKTVHHVNYQRLADHLSTCSTHLNTGIGVCGAEMLTQYLKPVIFPPRDMCQCQRHCWLSQLGGGAIDTYGWRPGVLLTIVKCTGRPTTQDDPSHMLTVPRPRDPALNGGVCSLY